MNYPPNSTKHRMKCYRLQLRDREHRPQTHKVKEARHVQRCGTGCAFPCRSWYPTSLRLERHHRRHSFLATNHPNTLLQKLTLLARNGSRDIDSTISGYVLLHRLHSRPHNTGDSALCFTCTFDSSDSLRNISVIMCTSSKSRQDLLGSDVVRNVLP